MKADFKFESLHKKATEANSQAQDIIASERRRRSDLEEELRAYSEVRRITFTLKFFYLYSSSMLLVIYFVLFLSHLSGIARLERTVVAPKQRERNKNAKA